jgi:hypothetical protein
MARTASARSGSGPPIPAAAGGSAPRRKVAPRSGNGLIQEVYLDRSGAEANWTAIVSDEQRALAAPEQKISTELQKELETASIVTVAIGFWLDHARGPSPVLDGEFSAAQAVVDANSKEFHRALAVSGDQWRKQVLAVAPRSGALVKAGLVVATLTGRECIKLRGLGSQGRRCCRQFGREFCGS